MTQYERSKAEQEIQNTVNQWKPQIIDNLVKEQDAAINRYHASELAIIKANASEALRWDGSKLGAELQVVRLLVDQAINATDKGPAFRGNSSTKQDKLQQLYHDATISGDIFKQRAVAEVLTSLPTGSDHELNHLQKQAERDLKAIRRTEDQQKAEEALEVAWQDVITHTTQLEEIAPLVGESVGVFGTGPINQAIKRIHIDRQTGERLIYDTDAEDIQPVVFVTPQDKTTTHFAEG